MRDLLLRSFSRIRILIPTLGAVGIVACNDESDTLFRCSEIRISLQRDTIFVGEVVDLQVTQVDTQGGQPCSATLHKAVLASVSDPTIIGVTPSRKIVGVGPGTATVALRSGREGSLATTIVTVVPRR